MREILFRAKTEPCSKDAISGKIELKPKWVYGYIDLGYMQDEKGAIISDEKAHSAYRCQYSTIGQYTGLMDKNGKRIFEGDIIQHGAEPAKVCFGEYAFDHEMKTHVGFYLEWINKTYYRIDFGFWANEREIEVIGNIHDNPELLRASNDDQPIL